jgi:hypothetical protein
MEKRKMTIAERVLRHIAKHPNGLRLGEIQQFIYEINYPGQSGGKRKSWRYHPKTGRSIPCEVKIFKGYWGTNLTGNPTNAGILESFCMKTEDRRYVVTEPIVGPFFRNHRRSKMTETYNLNRAGRTIAYKLREAQAPKCPHCGRANTWGDQHYFAPDGKAHMEMHSSAGWKSDCAGRVWSGSGRTGGLLTKVTKDRVEGLTECLRKNGAHYTLIEDTVSRFVLDNVI